MIYRLHYMLPVYSGIRQPGSCGILSTKSQLLGQQWMKSCVCLSCVFAVLSQCFKAVSWTIGNTSALHRVVAIACKGSSLLECKGQKASRNELCVWLANCCVKIWWSVCVKCSDVSRVLVADTKPVGSRRVSAASDDTGRDSTWRQRPVASACTMAATCSETIWTRGRKVYHREWQVTASDWLLLLSGSFSNSSSD